jgi:hypothetical protein
MAAVSSSQPTITTLFAEPKLAYAVLQAAEWSIYLTNFITYFGRTTPKHPVDVDLQDDSTISRRHAKIEYNFEEKRFEISALGKNPVIINGKITLRRYDEPLPLTSKMLVRMGTYSFFFILPKAKPQGSYPNFVFLWERHTFVFSEFEVDCFVGDLKLRSEASLQVREKPKPYQPHLEDLVRLERLFESAHLVVDNGYANWQIALLRSSGTSQEGQSCSTPTPTRARKT